MAQVRFGARSGAAPMFLGLVKLVLGLVFGGSLFRLLRAFPSRLLGSLMIFSGAPADVCNLFRDLVTVQRWSSSEAAPRPESSCEAGT